MALTTSTLTRGSVSGKTGTFWKGSLPEGSITSLAYNSTTQKFEGSVSKEIILGTKGTYVDADINISGTTKVNITPIGTDAAISNASIAGAVTYTATDGTVVTENNLPYLYLKEGYYRAGKIAVDILLKDITTDVAGATSMIISGKFAYNDKGQKIQGTMNGVSFTKSGTQTASATAAASATGSNVTIAEVANEASSGTGLVVKPKADATGGATGGTVTFTAGSTADYYYVTKSSSYEYTFPSASNTASQTKYYSITSASIAAGKTFGSATPSTSSVPGSVTDGLTIASGGTASVITNASGTLNVKNAGSLTTIGANTGTITVGNANDTNTGAISIAGTQNGNVTVSKLGSGTVSVTSTSTTGTVTVKGKSAASAITIISSGELVTTSRTSGSVVASGTATAADIGYHGTTAQTNDYALTTSGTVSTGTGWITAGSNEIKTTVYFGKNTQTLASVSDKTSGSASGTITPSSTVDTAITNASGKSITFSTPSVLTTAPSDSAYFKITSSASGGGTFSTKVVAKVTNTGGLQAADTTGKEIEGTVSGNITYASVTAKTAYIKVFGGDYYYEA